MAAFPAVGLEGPIVLANGSCLTLDNKGHVTTDTCDGGVFRAWRTEGNGAFTAIAVTGQLNSDDVKGSAQITAPNGDHLDGFTSALQPVAVSSPAEGTTVTTRPPTIEGTGKPGATVSVTTESGKSLDWVIVGTDGIWWLTPTNDSANTNPTLTATQTAGDGSTTATVSFTINAGQDQGLTATVDSVDADTTTAMLSGTGTAGDTITLTGPAGSQTVTVGDDGTWTANATGLAAGDNAITVTDGTDTITVTATIMPSPILNPMIAGGAGLAAVLALGTAMIIRRKTAA